MKVLLMFWGYYLKAIVFASSLMKEILWEG